MSYRNKTYVIFDGDNDMWAYRYMKGWKANDNIDFDFHDAHDLKPLTDRASEETVRARLRERFSNAKQVVVVVGDKTKNLHRFVRWEIDVAQKLDLPIVVVNLNGKKQIDKTLCPPILCDHFAVHVSFKAKIIKHALDDFPTFYHANKASKSGPHSYNASVYTGLGI